MDHSTDNSSPKYACTVCGNNEIRSTYNTYQVFIAEKNKLIYTRTESDDLGLLLYCNSCHEPIEIKDMNELIIE